MKNTVKAKFVVDRVMREFNSKGEAYSQKVCLGGVFDPELVKDASKKCWSPTGNITISITNSDDFDTFVKGEYFYVEFIPTGVNAEYAQSEIFEDSELGNTDRRPEIEYYESN